MITIRRVLLLAAAVLSLIILSPAAAYACTVTYQDGGTPELSDCAGGLPAAAAAVLGSVAAMAAVGMVLRGYLGGALSASDLAQFIADQVSPPPTTADGQPMTPIDAAARAELHAYLTDLAHSGQARSVTNTGAEYDYQRRTTGNTEYNIAPPGTPQTWADGIDHVYGLAQDAKYRGAPRSMYDPSSMEFQFLRERAIEDMDVRLKKYRNAIAYHGNPIRGVEITTNDLGVASFIRQRMAALGVPGRVRIVP